MKLIENVVARIKKELPDIIEKMYKAPPTAVPDSLDSVYISQITAAQEFINNNRKADLSQIKCILRKMLPREYHERIEELRECQEPKIININGGQNLIAPNAKNARQDTRRMLNSSCTIWQPAPTTSPCGADTSAPCGCTHNRKRRKVHPKYCESGIKQEFL